MLASIADLDLDGRKLDPKLAVSREDMGRSTRTDANSSSSNQKEPIKTNKLFVGGINPETEEAEFREYFEKYGTYDTLHALL